VAEETEVALQPLHTFSKLWNVPVRLRNVRFYTLMQVPVRLYGDSTCLKTVVL
jgi:hypothetical protein